MNVPNSVLKIMDRLCKNGYEVYAVGGCVRDSLLGLAPKDWDLTTNAMPDEIAKAFDDSKIIDTGIRFGTVGVVTDIGTVEITTYRTEYGYEDNRHPDGVTFVRNLEEDLKRRDFTVNAMAYSASDGIVDLFGGRDDLDNNIIRAVGNPSCRFDEDALRIMRGLRFASRYGFEIEPETALAMLEKADGLSSVSPERIMAELKDFMQGENVPKLIERFLDIFKIIIPELSAIEGFKQNSPYHNSDVLEHTLRVVEAVPNDLCLRLAALFHDIGKPLVYTEDESGIGHFYGHEKISEELTRKILNNLRFDKTTISEVCALVGGHMLYTDESEKSTKRMLNRFGESTLRKLLVLQRADNIALAPPYNIEREAHFDKLEEILNNIIEKNECFKISDLKVDGSDLIALGVPKGREIGDALNKLLDGVIDGKVSNEREELIKYLFG